MPAFVVLMTSSRSRSPVRLPFKGFGRSYSADPNIPLPVYLRRYHSEAYKHISEALTIDEEGGKSSRIYLLLHGVCVLAVKLQKVDEWNEMEQD